MPSTSNTEERLDAARLELLRLLEQEPAMSQRQLSQTLGLSLGKTHYLLHALLDMGLLKVRNFQRSDRKLAYAYVLTPSGLREKLRLTRTFLARKEEEFETLRYTIATLRRELGAVDTRDENRARQGGKP
ncbi:MarR family EPS-associated transcriptional regulator [Azohydromonas lata]|uniref:MarR family EPS-associated transcriptional regulator n=1 Tax=Azohydromonas lata TaxID=45677 RepID=A0ABU5IBR5_9BURK|nr:MarR family EPS-associated transcriptional regulator [Azohydromonas lata]MDZ5456542.1 MarR family EPS-associated transcriptional regulator [Azohydromonas lata]